MPRYKAYRLFKSGFRVVGGQRDTPSVVYNGHLKIYPSVSLGIPLYGSRNLAYIASEMDYMCPLWRVRYKPYWV